MPDYGQYTAIVEIFDPVSEVRAVALEPVAHIRTEFEITGLRLAELEVGRSVLR